MTRTPATVDHDATHDPAAAHAAADLADLVAHGPRFHGTAGIAAAGDWLAGRLRDAGHDVARQRVELPGWSPGAPGRLAVTSPVTRELPHWPMLWSGGTDGRMSGRVVPMGPQGLWGDSMTWRKLVVLGPDDQVVAYLHARDDGPAAPQPLPSGSDLTVAHLAIGRLDGLQLAEWIADGHVVEVALEASSGPVAAPAVSDNLVVDIAAADGAPAGSAGTVLLCAHYDTFFNTVGAYDNGSGTIALLHLAEAWAAAPPARPVRLVLFTAEEWHLGGSRDFVARSTPAELEALAYVLNIDGLGRSSFLEAFAAPETFELAVRDAVVEHGHATRPDLRLVSRFPPTTGTDDAAFHRAGIPSAFLTFNDLHRLHQPEDRPDPGIARNIAWTVPLVRRLVDTLPAPARVAAPGIL
jgi:hypothetical protein